MKLRSMRGTPILAIQHDNKNSFVPQLTYQTPKNLLDPTVKYCTMGPYLQSRHHQGRSLFLSRRGTQSQKRSVTRNCHQKRVWAYNESTTQLKNYLGLVTVASQSLDMLRGGDKSGKVISYRHRDRNAQTVPSPLYIHVWSGARHFQSWYTEDNIYGRIEALN